MRKRLVSVLLMVSVLWASAGLTLHKMACQVSGSVLYSFTDFNCCEADNLQTESLNIACCDFSEVDLQIQPVYESDKSSDIFDGHALLTMNFMAFGLPLFGALLPDLFYRSPPPLLRFTIAQLCVFLI